MKTVPLAAVPYQQFGIVLGGQNCSLAVFQKTTGVYLSMYVDNEPVSTTIRCLNLARLMEDRQYAGFVGDFMFVDTQGVSDPTYDGLGTRYELVYLEAADVAAATVE